MSFNFSKSKYCGLWQCPKIAWLRKYKPDEITVDGSVIARMEAGNVVGDLAMGLFGDFVEVTAYNGDKIDLSKMIENTKAEIEKGTPVICEASFDYNGLYCAVDILKKENDELKDHLISLARRVSMGKANLYDVVEDFLLQ